MIPHKVFSFSRFVMIEPWIPAFAGMTERTAGMTEKIEIAASR